jgi:hypothetical protein
VPYAALVILEGDAGKAARDYLVTVPRDTSLASVIYLVELQDGGVRKPLRSVDPGNLKSEEIVAKLVDLFGSLEDAPQPPPQGEKSPPPADGGKKDEPPKTDGPPAGAGNTPKKDEAPK